MNLAVLIGRLGKDPELRELKGGKEVCNFTMATDALPVEGEERADWHNIVVWGKAARACAAHLSKGRMVAVRGRMKTRSWEDPKGGKRWFSEVVAYQVDFLPGGRPEGAGARAEQGAPLAVAKGSGTKPDELPF